MSEESSSTGKGLSNPPEPGGLAHERFFLEAVDWELRRSERYWEPFTIALMETEEPFVAALESVLAQTMRRCDMAARLADDRFAALLIRSRAEFLPDFRKRLLSGLSARTKSTGDIFIGAASCPDDGTSAETLLDAAAAALEKARTEGQGRVSFVSHAKPQGATVSPRVLVVDDDPRNRKLLRAFLSGRRYEVTEADGGERAETLLQEEEFDLVLLDVMMPGMSGFEVCRRVKSRQATRGLPIILVTALNDVESKVKGIEAGADDFLTKPFQLEELAARTASLVRLKRTNNSMTDVENVLVSLAAAVEAKDHYTQGHTDRAARLAMNVGHRMALSADEINCLRIGGALHDVGKIGVPEVILNKPGPLTDEEWNVMRTHPEVGYRICESLSKTLGQALQVIRQHHEKLDGSSYPDGLKGGQISVLSRIMGVVDIYDALTTDRPYRKALSHQRAFEILRKEATEGKLDGEVVEGLIQEVQKER